MHQSLQCLFKFHTILLLIFLDGCLQISPALGEEKSEKVIDYPGIDDPFGDPISNYKTEWTESEPNEPGEPKLRNFVIGLDGGVGIYTGGLGQSTDPGFYAGGRLLYFITHKIGIELAVHFADQLETINTTTLQAEISTRLIPITLAGRYYVGSKKSKTIALVNPFLTLGGGIYLRSQTPTQSNLTIDAGSNNQFGIFAGAGVEFPLIKHRLFLGLDLRFHLVFFFDESDTLNGNVLEGSRAGDYFTPVVTLSWNL